AAARVVNRGAGGQGEFAECAERLVVVDIEPAAAVDRRSAKSRVRAVEVDGPAVDGGAKIRRAGGATVEVAPVQGQGARAILGQAAGVHRVNLAAEPPGRYRVTGPVDRKSLIAASRCDGAPRRPQG